MVEIVKDFGRSVKIIPTVKNDDNEAYDAWLAGKKYTYKFSNLLNMGSGCIYKWKYLKSWCSKWKFQSFYAKLHSQNLQSLKKMWKVSLLKDCIQENLPVWRWFWTFRHLGGFVCTFEGPRHVQSCPLLLESSLNLLVLLLRLQAWPQWWSGCSSQRTAL